MTLEANPGSALSKQLKGDLFNISFELTRCQCQVVTGNERMPYFGTIGNLEKASILCENLQSQFSAFRMIQQKMISRVFSRLYFQEFLVDLG